MEPRRRRSEDVEVTAGMRRAGKEVFMRAVASGDLDDALERAFKAMERCRRDELEGRLRHRLGTLHG